MAKLIVRNARIATMRAGRYSIVEEGAVIAAAGAIEWVGAARDLAGRTGDAQEIDAGGALVTPGLIDCHTHLVYAGYRAKDFEMQLAGASYEQIARAGGGILSTVRATRAASDAELRDASARRLEALMSEGVTTVEIKSGYGLALDQEMRLLRIARSLADTRSVAIETTLLAAHAVPPEMKGRADDYVDAICEEMIPRAAKERLASAVDAFCERIAFDVPQVRRVFTAARANGLGVKLHADQLSQSGGASLAAEFGALSADHLEHADEAGIAALARAGTVAVLLPGAFYFLRETKVPPVQALRKHRVPIAVATDCNPGTSPCTSLLTIMNMACTLFRITPEEALAGVTCHAAHALGLLDRGVIEAGKRADLVIWDADDPAHLSWQIAGLKPRQAIFAGAPRC